MGSCLETGQMQKFSRVTGPLGKTAQGEPLQTHKQTTPVEAHCNLQNVTHFFKKKIQMWHKTGLLGKALVKRQQIFYSHKFLICQPIYGEHVGIGVPPHGATEAQNPNLFLHTCLCIPRRKRVCVTFSFIKGVSVCRNNKLWIMDGQILRQIRFWGIRKDCRSLVGSK